MPEADEAAMSRRWARGESGASATHRNVVECQRFERMRFAPRSCTELHAESPRDRLRELLGAIAATDLGEQERCWLQELSDDDRLSGTPDGCLAASFQVFYALLLPSKKACKYNFCSTLPSSEDGLVTVLSMPLPLRSWKGKQHCSSCCVCGRGHPNIPDIEPYCTPSMSLKL